jgi:NTE family protein
VSASGGDWASEERSTPRSLGPRPDKAALVLSGGGARGAYEVGVLAGMAEVLGLGERGAAPFDVFAGTSVGAINATYLAAHADRADLGVGGLVETWESLELSRDLRVDSAALLGLPRSFPFPSWPRGERARRAEHYGRALLDPRPLEQIVEKSIPWQRLATNVREGVVRALMVSALDVAGGRTTMFAQLAEGTTVVTSKDKRRVQREGPITSEHVLASAAIPMIYPARRIGDAYYCDGGLRFNTPISPAIRAGSTRLVVVSLLHPNPPASRPRTALAQYPNPLFLLGKVLNALLLDPVDYDLQVLSRLNRLIEVLEQTLAPDEFAEVMRVIEQERGLRYRHVRTLVFRPSEDIGVLAGEYLREEHPRWRGPARLLGSALRRARSIGQSVETDLGSFLLFDGGFARVLMDLGHRDATRRADEIRAFFPELAATSPLPR